MTQPEVIAAPAIRIQKAQSFAQGRMVSVLPNKRTNGSIKIMPKIITPNPDRIEAQKEVDAQTFAALISWFPSLRAILLPATCPNTNPKACKIAIKPNTTPVAAEAEVPNVPTHEELGGFKQESRS